MKKYLILLWICFSLTGIAAGQDDALTTDEKETQKEVESKGVGGIVDEIFAIETLKRTVRADEVEDELDIKKRIETFEKTTGIKVNIINYYNVKSFWYHVYYLFDDFDPDVETSEEIINFEIIFNRDQSGKIISIDIICTPSQGLLDKVSNEEARKIADDVMLPVCKPSEDMEKEFRYAKDAVYAGLDNIQRTNSGYEENTSSIDCSQQGTVLNPGKGGIVCKDQKITLGDDPILTDPNGIELDLNKFPGLELKWFDEAGNIVPGSTYFPEVTIGKSTAYTLKLFNNKKYQCESRVEYKVLEIKSTNITVCPNEKFVLPLPEVNLDGKTPQGYSCSWKLSDGREVKECRSEIELKNSDPLTLAISYNGASCTQIVDVSFKEVVQETQYKVKDTWVTFADKSSEFVSITETQNISLKYLVGNEPCPCRDQLEWRVTKPDFSKTYQQPEVNLSLGVGVYDVTLMCGATPVRHLTLWVIEQYILDALGTLDMAQIIKFFGKCKSPETGLVPVCLYEGWEYSKYQWDAPFMAGIVDGAWETVELVWSIDKFILAWSPVLPFAYVGHPLAIPGLLPYDNPYFKTAEAEATRKQTKEFFILLKLMATDWETFKKVYQTLGEEIVKYAGTTWGTDWRARYNHGKLVFDVATMFIGVGEVKAALKSGKFAVELGNIIRKAPVNAVKRILAFPGNAAKSLVSLTKKLKTKLVVLQERVFLEIEAQRVFEILPDKLDNIQWGNGTHIAHEIEDASFIGPSGGPEVGKLHVVKDQNGFYSVRVVKVGTVSKAFVKTTMPKEFMDALKAFGKTEDEIAEYFMKYHNDNSMKFFNEIYEMMAKYPSMQAKEAYVLWGYTTNFFYRNLNEWLRTGTNTAKTADITTLLRSALARLPTSNSGIAYRAIEFKDPALLNNFLTSHKKGAIVKYDDFVSCGDNEAAAFYNKPEKNVRIIMENVKSAPDISDFADGIKFRNYARKELLLEPGRKYEIIEVKEINGIHYLKLKEQ